MDVSQNSLHVSESLHKWCNFRKNILLARRFFYIWSFLNMATKSISKAAIGRSNRSNSFLSCCKKKGRKAVNNDRRTNVLIGPIRRRFMPHNFPSFNQKCSKMAVWQAWYISCSGKIWIRYFFTVSQVRLEINHFYKTFCNHFCWKQSIFVFSIYYFLYKTN